MGELGDEIKEMLDGFVPPEEGQQQDQVEEIQETGEAETETETDTTVEEEVTDEGSEEGEEEQEEAAETVAEDDESEEVEEEEVVGEVEEEQEEQQQPDMTGILNELATGKIELEEADIDKTEAASEQQPQVQEQQAQSEFDPFDKHDFDSVVSDPKAFTALIQDVGAQLQNQIQETVMMAVTNIVGYQVQQQLTLKEMTERFWQDNQDLTAVRPYVAKVAETLQSRKPDMTLEQIFEKTAELVRKKLGIANVKGGGSGGTETKTRRTRKPAFAKKSGARKQVKPSTTTKLEKEIDDLIEDF